MTLRSRVVVALALTLACGVAIGIPIGQATAPAQSAKAAKSITPSRWYYHLDGVESVLCGEVTDAVRYRVHPLPAGRTPPDRDRDPDAMAAIARRALAAHSARIRTGGYELAAAAQVAAAAIGTPGEEDARQALADAALQLHWDCGSGVD